MGRVAVVMTTEWEVADPETFVSLVQVLAARAECALVRDGVEGPFVFTPDDAQRMALACREITTVGEALEWLVLDAMPRELAGAWACSGEVAAVEDAAVDLTVG